MTFVEAMQSLGGVGVLIGATAYALKERSKAVRVNAESNASAISELRATTKHLRDRLDDCERKHDEAKKVTGRAEAAAHDALEIANRMDRYIRVLAQEIVTLGGQVPHMPSITPRAFPAVSGAVKEDT
jgi:methylthioribose-1-phosphate isomerase